MVDTENPVLDFTAMDRCDRCPGQAVSLAQHEDFGELYFCFHHIFEHRNTLEDDGWAVIDDLGRYEELGITV